MRESPARPVWTADLNGAAVSTRGARGTSAGRVVRGAADEAGGHAARAAFGALATAVTFVLALGLGFVFLLAVGGVLTF